jgi:hypothetical protein
MTPRRTKYGNRKVVVDDISESTLHGRVAKYLDAVIRPPMVWTSIDAGAGKMRPRTARQRKNRGVKKGWPDILILAPGPNLLGIELKDGDGKQKPEQIDVERAFHGCRAWYVLCRSVEEVERAVAFVLKPERNAA